MFKKNKFLKFSTGAALMASAPALLSFAGEGENYSANEIKKNKIQDQDSLTCLTVLKFALLGFTVIGLIIYGFAVAGRKAELKNLDEQIARENAIRTKREKLKEALKKQDELSEKVQAEEKERERIKPLNLQKFKENKIRELLEARNKKELIINKLNYLLCSGSGYLGKVSHLVDLCNYLILIGKKTVSEQEKGDLSKLREGIKNYAPVKRDGRYTTCISEASAEDLLKDVIGKFKNDDLRDINFIGKSLKNDKILMGNDTFDAKTFLVKGEYNEDYSALLNEFIKSLKDFNWEIKNWGWLKARATTFMEYLQEEKKHLQGMKDALKGGWY